MRCKNFPLYWKRERLYWPTTTRAFGDGRVEDKGRSDRKSILNKNVVETRKLYTSEDRPKVQFKSETKNSTSERSLEKKKFFFI